MSVELSPVTPKRSPKRKRSESLDSKNRANDNEEDVQLQYAYNDDLTSDVEDTFHTPEEGSGDESIRTKRRKVERPQQLNYVPRLTLRGHKRGVAAVKFSPDGKWIASCCTDTAERK